MLPPSTTRIMALPPPTRKRMMAITVIIILALWWWFGVNSVKGGADMSEETCQQKLKDILAVCGTELCSLDREYAPARAVVDAAYLANQRAITKNKAATCKMLFSETAEQVLDTYAWPPPRTIPSCMYSDFTLRGRASVTSWYHHQKYGGAEARVPEWTVAMVDEFKKTTISGSFSGGYGATMTAFVHKAVKQANVRGARVLVVGSESPWLESMLLAEGASHVTTLEYGIIRSSHPQISTMLPHDFNVLYREGKLEPFDLIVSISSLEHSGLGRYGDALNPWGDVMTVAKLRCVTKPGTGHILLGLPVAREEDSISFNAHRLYGSIRWPIVLTDWTTKWFDVMPPVMFSFLENEAYRHGIAYAKIE